MPEVVTVVAPVQYVFMAYKRPSVSDAHSSSSSSVPTLFPTTQASLGYIYIFGFISLGAGLQSTAGGHTL
jgi:hypothetical protein